MNAMNPINKDPRAQRAIQRWEDLKSRRAMHEPDWEAIAKLIRPQRGGFSSSDPSNRKLEKPLSSEPILASSSFAAGIYAAITNPANRWFGYGTPDEDLNKWKPMATWIDMADRITMASFSPSVSSFYSSTYQAYQDISAFGQAACYDEIDVGSRRFIDVSLSLAEVVVDIDAHGRVIEWVRRYQLTPAAAVREFKKSGDNLPAKVKELAQKGDIGKITFYHHIVPNDELVPGKIGHRGMKFLSLTACDVETSLVRIKGNHEMPTYYPRWDVDSGMTYGTGPGFIALASTRSNQLMQAATLRAAQFAADPTKLAPDRSTIPLNGAVRPGSTVYGAVDQRGNQLLRNMEANTSIGLTLEEKRSVMEAVKDVFQYSIMSLSGRTGITDDESRIMEEARLRNWAPNADRLMEEYAARKVERRFQLLFRAGQIPPPPDGIPDNMPLQVRYQSQATMALKAREGLQARQFLNDMTALSRLNPRFGMRVDPDAAAEVLHDASPSLPAKILRSREETDALEQAAAEQQQQAQALQMAQSGAGAFKDIATAAAAGGEV